MRQFLTAILLLAGVPAAVAQKVPELGYVFPPVVQAGAVTKVSLGGYDITPDMQFFVRDDRIRLTAPGPPGEFFVPEPPYWFGEKGRLTAFPIPREIQAEIEVPSACEPGLVRWQVANAGGASAAAVFYVSNGTEIVEHRYRDEPQTLPPLPVAVSGRIRKISEIDRYRLRVPNDGPVTVELFARRLGANWNAIVEVRNDEGLLIADTADTEGDDNAITFFAVADHDYEISLYDLDYRGNRAFVYRLACSAGPRVATTLPAVGQRGQTIDVDFIGFGLASGSAKPERVRRTVEFPSDPNQHVLQYSLETESGASSTVTIPLGNLVETVEASRQNDEPVDLTAPAAVTGTFEAPGAGGSKTRESYRFAAKKDEVWRISAQSRAIGADLDISLTILDESGKSVATSDDLPGTTDAGLEFRAPADGKFTCIVDDLSAAGEDRVAVYRLAIERAGPDFTLSIPETLNVPIGGKGQLEVKAELTAGFKQDISIEITGLPDGVTAGPDPKIAAGGKSVKIPIEVAEDAAAIAALIQVVGTATIGDETITRTALSPLSGNLCPCVPRSGRATELLLATTLRPSFAVELVDRNRQRDVPRGTTYPAPFVIKRDEGFEGEILLQMAARQGRHRQGITAPVLAVSPGTTNVLYPCFMPEWLETDRTTRMVVHGVARVADPKGNERYVTAPANARVTMILEGALMKLTQQAPEITARAGDTFEVPFELSRSPRLPEDATIELVTPPELSGLLSAEPLSVNATQPTGVLRIQSLESPDVRGRWTLQLRARALQDNRWPVVSQDEVVVEFGEGTDR